ncbi:MAG: hypothetical protein KC910_16930 [Candidatus Eremiobacteraeota bacterium]|nr:hypothetical protein [Candidatus Eremiobacteraeota bacterium]
MTRTDYMSYADKIGQKTQKLVEEKRYPLNFALLVARRESDPGNLFLPKVSSLELGQATRNLRAVRPELRVSEAFTEAAVSRHI